MRQINSLTLEKIKSWEGFRGQTYDDATGNVILDAGDQVLGTLTIGYGHTGPDVKPGQRMTEAQAAQLLLTDLQRFEKGVERAVSVPLTDNQFGALVSFAFNVGLGGRKPGDGFLTSTLLKKLNAGDYAAVPGELTKWNKTTIGGKKVVSDGLVNRRAAEVGLWATGSFVSSNTVPVSPSTPPVITRETLSWGAGILGSLGSVFAGSGPIQYGLAAVIVIGVAVGAYSFVQNRRGR